MVQQELTHIYETQELKTKVKDLKSCFNQWRNLYIILFSFHSTNLDDATVYIAIESVL